MQTVHSKMVGMLGIVAGSFVVSCQAADEPPPFESFGEPAESHDRRGIGVEGFEIGSVEQGICVDVDARRSLAVTDVDILAQFPLGDVITQLLSQAGSAQTRKDLFVQWSSLFDCTSPPATINGFPFDCRFQEGTADVQATIADPTTLYTPVGVFNRFDLAPIDGSNCGEYRLVFARNSGFPGPTGSPNARRFIIFESLLMNPQPQQGLAGCAPVAQMWANLSTTASEATRAQTLRNFFFNGLSGFSPVIHINNFGADATRPAGQIRVNNFLVSPWMLHEFKLNRSGSTLNFVQVTDKQTPFAGLFADLGNTGTLQSVDFQNNVFIPQARFPSAGLAVADLNRFNYAVPDQFNAGQSNSQDFLFSISQTATDRGFGFKNSLNAAVQSSGGTLSANQLINRAEALSCGGCHQLSGGKDMGFGQTWPSSLGFTHTSEHTETSSEGPRHLISPAITNLFLPRREQVLESFLCASPPPVALPARIEAERYVRFSDGTPSNQGATGSPQCNRGDAVDQQSTTDQDGRCAMGWTTAGEWLEYDVSVAASATFDITARIGSGASGKTIRVLIDGVAKGTVTAQNFSNWTSYGTRKLATVPLSAGNHVVRIEFVTGDVNLNSFDIQLHQPIALPARIEAEAFHRANELDTPNNGLTNGELTCDQGSSVDLWRTTDNNGACNIGWTQAGEWLEYDVFVPQEGRFEYVIRAASAATGKKLKLLIDGVAQPSFTVATGGWDTYADFGADVLLTQGNHVLRVLFETNDVNLNYVNLVPIITTPGLLQESGYARFFDTDLINHGAAASPQCNKGDGVDFAATTDQLGLCNIGWGQPGEWVQYSVRAGQASSWQLTLRVASGAAGKTVQVLVDGTSVGTFAVANNGWQVFQDLNVSVPFANTAGQIRDVRLVFPQGGVDLNHIFFNN